MKKPSSINIKECEKALKAMLEEEKKALLNALRARDKAKIIAKWCR